MVGSISRPTEMKLPKKVLEILANDKYRKATWVKAEVDLIRYAYGNGNGPTTISKALKAMGFERQPHQIAAKIEAMITSGELKKEAK